MDRKNEYNWIKTLTIGFGIASVGIVIAVLLYLTTHR